MSESEKKLVQAQAEIERLRAELAIAIKLYAKARRISIDDATDNVHDARLIDLP